MRILVTGTAGFIGFHLTNKLLSLGHTVVGIDSINDYYDVQLKYNRLASAGINAQGLAFNQMASAMDRPYRFYRMQLEDREPMEKLFAAEQFDAVVNLAAQAGVRYSLTNPYAYIDANIVGFMNILECCRHYGVKNLAYASSSSVYGLNENIPFSTHGTADHPISLYAASKKANEMMAHTYSHLYGISTTGLRFFTVYGPWGRPDMALFIFTKAILEGRPIDVFNNGNMQRDFTYVDDIVRGIVGVVENPAAPNPNWNPANPDSSSSSAPYRVYNIGNNSPVMLTEFIDAIEEKLGKKSVRNLMPIQPGDVPRTYADVADLVNDLGYKPSTPIKEGVSNFIDWYLEYYK